MILAALAFVATAAGAPEAQGAPPSGGPAPAPAPEPLRVECDGVVEWSAGGKGPGRLRLSGGVRVLRGETVLTARSADAVLAPGATSPEAVLAEGDVSLDSPRFSARADVATVRRAAASSTSGDEKAPPDGEAEDGPAKPPAPPSFDVTLERRERAEVELRAGDVLVACLGPLVYAGLSREATLAGGVRAESPRFRARCEEARVVFAERAAKPPAAAGDAARAGGEAEPEEEQEVEEAEAPARPGPTEEPSTERGVADDDAQDDAAGRPPAEEGGAAKPGEDAGARKAEEPLPAVERVDLVGGVVLEAKGKKGEAVRRVRAARAVYEAAGETVAFTGEPAPVVEYAGVTLTAPEIVLHLRENRVEPKGGKMRAVLGPTK